MDPFILLSPSTPKFPSRGHSRSPSRSPTRSRIIDDILSDLSPATTLDAFTNASGALRASIEAATPSQRAFGIRAAVASKKIEEWAGELAGWPWPAGKGSPSAGFEIPAAKRRKLSVPDGGRTGRRTNDTSTAHGYQNGDLEKDGEEEYWGSLPATYVIKYEERIDEISEDMEDLNVEEIKSRVLDTHVLPRSPHSSPHPAREATPVSPSSTNSYTRMDDFTAVVTATVLQALPNLSRLMALMDIWSIRLLILHQIPHLLVSLSDAEMALKSGWNTLDQLTTSKPESDGLSRDNYEIMRDILQEKVTLLGQKIDHMLDTLEGRQDTIPEAWLDRMEAIELDYREWAVNGDRKVREGEWARDAARRRAQKLMAIPEDEVALEQHLDEETELKGELTNLPVELLTDVENKAVLDESSSTLPTREIIIPTVLDGTNSTLPVEELRTLDHPVSPTVSLSQLDGARDSEPASIALDTLTPDGTPMGHGSTPDPMGYFSAADIVASQLPPSDLVNEVNKTDTLQRHGFESQNFETTELSMPLPPSTGLSNKIEGSSIESDNSAPTATVPTASVPDKAAESISVGSSPERLFQNERPQTPTKVPRFGHGFANLLRASSFDNYKPSESDPLTVASKATTKSNEEHSSTETQRPATPIELAPEANLAEYIPEPATHVVEITSETTTSPPTSPQAVLEQISPATSSQQGTTEMISSVRSEESNFNEDTSLMTSETIKQQQEQEPDAEDLSFLTPHKASLTIPFPQFTTPERLGISHSRQISTSSTISGYSMSDPSPEICEAATEYFSPVVSPGRGEGDWSLSATPTHGFLLGSPSIPRYVDEERPDTPRAHQQTAETTSTMNNAYPVENWVMDEKTATPIQSPPEISNFTQGKRSEMTTDHEKLDPETPSKTTAASERHESNEDLPTGPFTRSRSPDSPLDPQSPLTDEKAVLSFEDFNDSPSIGRVRIYGEGNDYSPPSSPPPIPPMSNRRSLHVQVEAYDAESLSSESPLTPSDSSFLSNVSLSSAQIISTPSKVSDDQLQQQISEILESIPARIRLTSEPDASPHSQSELRPAKQRSSLGSNFRPSSRAATPSFTLAPAYAKSRRPRPQNGTPEIKLYHLSRSTGEAPIKLFVRLVGEHGERVMVRVGGGWADLGEYLKEYAAHHGRRSGTDKGVSNKDKIEIQDLPPRTVSSGSVNTLRNGNGRSSPISFSRPASSLERPMSSLNIRKTRRSVGEDERGNSYSSPYGSRSPSTPLPMRSLSRQGTPAYETPPARSSSRLSWTEEESSLGLAGPKSRKVEISAENAAWVESMKEKVRLASAEKDRDRERKEREARDRKNNNGGAVDQFGEIGKVGGTKRLFKKSLIGSGGPGAGP